MIVISICLILVTNYFISRTLKFENLLELVLAQFLVVCANIILTFEITSLLGKLNQPAVFVSVQLLWLAASIVFFRFSKTQGQNPNGGLIKKTISDLGHFLKANKGLAVYFALIALGYLVLLVFTIIYPQNTSDSMYNHLSRIAHWLQQGSLKPYASFTAFGIVFPYNNSLLMMWSMLFLHSDQFTGLVQWCASLILAGTIYGLSLELGFKPKQAALSALIFLTFPIILLESMTAQNDILTAAFFLSAVYLFIRGFKHSSRTSIFFSALSVALAAGTKQYLILAAPGFLLIFIYFLLQKNIPDRKKLAVNFVIFTLVSTLLFGSYAYIQNTLNYHSPIGPKDLDTIYSGAPVSSSLSQKLAFNSSRLFTQFVSCEGLPLPWEDRCLVAKSTFFKGIFASPNFDLESHQYLLEADCSDTCFAYSTRYPLNEESAWYGILSWILLLPGILVALVESLRKKQWLPLLLIVTALIYFLCISVIKNGWDAYVGRYLILSVALVMPFAGYLLSDRKLVQRIFTTLIVLASCFIFTYTILNNDSKPILTKQKMVQVQKWGKEHNILVTKIAYKLTPWFREQKSYLDYDRDQLRVFEANYMFAPTYLAETYVPLDASISLVAPQNQIFFDYLFYGPNLTRTVYDIPYLDDADTNQQLETLVPQYILVSPDVTPAIDPRYFLIDHLDNWQIYKVQ